MSADPPHSVSPLTHALGCTPKAINHRLFNIKKAGKSINNPSATPTKPNLSTSTKSTPATAPSRNRNHDKNEREGEPDADGELTNDLVSPTPKKRGRPTKAESEARKKVKVEHMKAKPSSPSVDKSDGEVDEI